MCLPKQLCHTSDGTPACAYHLAAFCLAGRVCPGSRVDAAKLCAWPWAAAAGRRRGTRTIPAAPGPVRSSSASAPTVRALRQPGPSSSAAHGTSTPCLLWGACRTPWPSSARLCPLRRWAIRRTASARLPGRACSCLPAAAARCSGQCLLPSSRLPSTAPPIWASPTWAWGPVWCRANATPQPILCKIGQRWRQKGRHGLVGLRGSLCCMRVVR